MRTTVKLDPEQAEELQEEEQQTTLVHQPQGEEQPLTISSLMAHVHLIETVMQNVMRKDEHYGVIPGCGKKPTLLKAGAEKLMLTFRLCPEIEVREEVLPQGHKRFSVRCALYSRSRILLGQGVGEASTTETKWRYRWENTGAYVPKTYWDSRDPALLGGEDYVPRKTEGKWMIFHRVEHGNPSDYFNTCLKMAKKRALVDAVLTCTAASDMFTQDIEEMGEPSEEASAPATISARDVPDMVEGPEEEWDEYGEYGEVPDPPSLPPKEPKGKTISAAQGKRLFAMAMSAGLNKTQLLKHLGAAYGAENTSALTTTQAKELEEWIRKTQKGK